MPDSWDFEEVHSPNHQSSLQILLKLPWLIKQQVASGDVRASLNDESEEETANKKNRSRFRAILTQLGYNELPKTIKINKIITQTQVIYFICTAGG